MTDLAAPGSRAWRATRRIATALPAAAVLAVLAVVPASAQAHSEEFTPGQSFTPASSGFEARYSGGHAEPQNLIVHAVLGGIPFEIINSSFESR